jgi:tyrosinase
MSKPSASEPLPVAVREELFEALRPSLQRLQITRRQFLQLTAAGAAASMLVGCNPTFQALLDRIRNRPVRRDINSLSATDPVLTTYKSAIQLIKALPASDKRSWVNQSNIHLNFCPHGNWLFLPWHRAYLWRFEEICRELTGQNTFALPYWNWSKDPKIPAVFFDSASPLYDSTRAANPSSTLLPGSVAPTVLENILDQTNFLLFASGSIAATTGQRTGASYGPLEGNPHNAVHGFVGGNMGQYVSPLDPIFWTHHNMIEAIWVEWNWKRGNPNTNDSAWTQRKFTEFVDRAGNPVSVTTFEMILYPLLNYRYDDPLLGVA